ncbi:MAG: low molecular weight phosphotyrosine protein phosphatase [Propionibacteriaceae bacterium]|nr:low molecular weight phosphotyrosine protein phosphatase [Propionibacteriaceae bacterium]
MTAASNKTRSVVFVCHGNICRSPMAERVAEGWAQRHGITDVIFSSAATSREEIGHGIDPRASKVLAAHGYRIGGHRAHQITSDEIEAAALVAVMERHQLEHLRRLAPEADNLAMLTRFDPDAAPWAPIDDPWYGGPAGFEDTLTVIEACVPGLMDWLAG